MSAARGGAEGVAATSGGGEGGVVAKTDVPSTSGFRDDTSLPATRSDTPRAATSPDPSVAPVMRRVVTLALLALLLLIVGVVPALAQPPAVNVDDPRVYEVGSQLRCVVCLNLSVADSPSEMANQMRGVVRERLAAGETPDQVIQYFVDKYGEWILLKPRRHGFNWLVWLAPGIAVAIGLAIFAIVVRRWTKRGRRTAAPVAVDPAMRERIRLELEGDR